MAKFTFNIDVYSDTICPWCYIGQKALDRAIATYTAQHPDVEFKTTWKPYILYPNWAASAYDKAAAANSVFGPNAPEIFKRLDRLGAEYGREGKTGNSRDSHQLILLAMEQDAAAAAASSSSSPPSTSPSTSPSSSPSSNTPTNTPSTTTTTKTTSQEENANPHPIQPPPHPDPPVHHHLVPLHLPLSTLPPTSPRAPSSPAPAVELGLLPTEAAAHAYLDRRDDDDTASASRAPRQAGVTAVPSYVVQGRWQVGGMQREGVWMRLFERVRAVVVVVEAEGEREGEQDGERGGEGEDDS